MCAAPGYDTLHCSTRTVKIAYNRIEIMCCVHCVGKHVRISHIASRRKLNHQKIKCTEQNLRKKAALEICYGICGELSLLVSRYSVRRNNVIKAVFVLVDEAQIFSIWREAMAAAVADRHNQFHRDAMCRNLKRIPDILLSLHSIATAAAAAAASCGLSFAKRLFSYFPSFFSGGWLPCRLVIVKCTNGTILL